MASLLLRITPLIALAMTSPALAGPQPPNIVFILIDDLRHDTFGHAGHPYIETPNIDSLAHDGLRFTGAMVTTSLCSPARASFLTGQYMHHHKVVDNADRMRPDTVTFPQLLQRAEYETAFIGKWHMGGSSDAPRPGFDHWVSFRGQGTYAPGTQKLNVNGQYVPRKKYMTDELTDHAVSWLADRDGDRPFLLYLSHKGVHGLYDPAERHRDRYREKDFIPPATMKRDESNRGNQPMWVRDQRNSWHGVEYPYHGRSGQSVAQMYKHYCEMILSIDDSVGAVRQALRDQAHDRDTLVIFTSDGGHLWGEQGLIDKRCAYEASIRIPLLMSWPSVIPAGTTCDRLVANIDVAPTITELAGVTTPDWMDGRSLVPFLTDPDTDPDWRSDVLYEYYWEPAFPQTPTTFALRGPRYKLIQYHGRWDTDELYDLQEDPDETHNLIDQPSQQRRVTDLRKRLHARLQETGGLVIPLGFKRNHGSNKRLESGSTRSPFPPHMIQKHPTSKKPPLSKSP